MSGVKLGTALPAFIGVFDTETDGIDVENCHIVTAFIGVMDVASGQIIERWEWLLNTGHEIPKGASDVHGITTERMQAEGTDPKQGVFEMAQRLDAIAKRGIILVAMNAVFDFTLLDRELLRHWSTMRPLMEPNDDGVILQPLVFDPMVFDRAVDKFRKGTRKLVDLAAVYGVPVETNAHDAEADCRMAGRVAIKLLGHSRLAEMSLSEVHAKLIPTHRNNNNSLADFWEKNVSRLPAEERAARLQAIKEVRETAGQWPMRPRPTTRGVTE